MLEIKAIKLEEEIFFPYGDIIINPKKEPDFSNEILNFWPGISDINTTGSIAQFNWLQIIGIRSFICKQFERHVLTSEALIPMDSPSIIVLALSKNMNGANLQVDTDTIKAFIFDGTVAVNLRKGIWHSLPFPLTTDANFIIVFQKQSANNIEIIDLKEPVKIIL